MPTPGIHNYFVCACLPFLAVDAWRRHVSADEGIIFKRGWNKKGGEGRFIICLAQTPSDYRIKVRGI